MTEVLVVRVPETLFAQRAYALRVILDEFLGLAYDLKPHSAPHYEISHGAKRLFLADTCFSEDESMKPVRIPVIDWDPSGAGFDVAPVAVLFGAPKIERTDAMVSCDLDVIGTVFFMLSRWEEIQSPDRDRHDRFPGTASQAHRSGFLDRPIVDEYVELLWAMMHHLWPSLQRRESVGCVLVTCDVDHPFEEELTSIGKCSRAIAGDVLKRGQPLAATRKFRGYVGNRFGDYRYDRNYTFDWYMDTCERAGRRAAFYFIADNTAGKIDGSYRLHDRGIRRALNAISARGHEIGVHGSYNTYRDAAQVSRERTLMSEACAAAKADPHIRGNRQHYLRWDAQETPDHLDGAGYEYDTTGGYADVPGFRFGTARAFTMWSWRNRRPLALKQRPLIVMDRTLFGRQYLSMNDRDAALSLALRLRANATRYGGDFTLLWHNSSLHTRDDREMFTTLIQ